MDGRRSGRGRCDRAPGQSAPRATIAIVLPDGGSFTHMHMTSSVLVKSNLESAWAFLADQNNAPRWDRSVARVDLLSPPPLTVGSIVQTTAPSGMKQEFRVDELSATGTLRFSLMHSPWFRTAQLTFTLAPVTTGVRIT